MCVPGRHWSATPAATFVLVVRVCDEAVTTGCGLLALCVRGCAPRWGGGGAVVCGFEHAGFAGGVYGNTTVARVCVSTGSQHSTPWIPMQVCRQERCAPTQSVAEHDMMRLGNCLHTTTGWRSSSLGHKVSRWHSHTKRAGRAPTPSLRIFHYEQSVHGRQHDAQDAIVAAAVDSAAKDVRRSQ